MRSRPRFKKTKPRTLSKKGVFDRSVRRIDEHTYLHFTKGVKRVSKYDKMLDERRVGGAL